MSNLDYNIINECNKNNAYLDSRNRLCIKVGNHNYKYFKEAYKIEKNEFNERVVIYYILLSDENHDKSCKKLVKDSYGRIIVPVSDKFIEYVKDILTKKELDCCMTEFSKKFDALGVF